MSLLSARLTTYLRCDDSSRPRARAALWSAMAGAVLAAATCSPSGGGGSGGASYTRHRGRYVVRAVDLDPAVERIFRPWALFFARARATGALGFAHTGQNHLGEGFWGAIAAQ